MTGIVFALLWTPLYTTAGVMVCRKTGRSWWLLPRTVSQGFLAAGFGTAVAYGTDRIWVEWAIGSGWMLAGFLLWHHRRRKRRRALALLGAKSRALRDAIVRRMRRERQPRRVLRPHPVPS
jgi:hypothetical protein